MKNIYYALKQVFKPKNTNAIKLLSLTLGITISSILMCKVAFDRSFDNFHSDVENLNVLYMHWTINDEDKGFQRQCIPAIAPELKSKMANIKAITRFQHYEKEWYTKDNEPIQMVMARVDTSFFDVFDFQVLSGNPKEILSSDDGIMISEKTSLKFYQTIDCIGKTIAQNKKTYTIKGVFKDLPRNSHLDPIEAVGAGWFSDRKTGGDNSFTYFRISNNSSIEELTQTVNEIMAPWYEEMKQRAIVIDFKVDNIREISREESKDRSLMLSLLSLLVILVAGFNFALLSISSLSTRAKEVGAHKASGASSLGIFKMIIWESIIYTLFALLLSAILIFSARTLLETIVGKYEDILEFQNMWAVGVVLIGIILIGGVLPAILFAKISVTQVFRRFTATKARWKVALIFTQFTATIFTFSFLFVILSQYNTLMTHDLGYNHDKLIHIELQNFNLAEKELIRNELKTLSQVEDVTFSSNLIPYSGGGYPIFNLTSSQQLGISDMTTIDTNYVRLHNLKLVTGSSSPIQHLSVDSTTNETRSVDEIIVNQAFLRRLGASTDQLTDFKMFGQTFHICGVVEDFQTSSLHSAIKPLMMTRYNMDRGWGYATIRLNEVTTENVNLVNKKMKSLFPTKGYEMSTYKETIASQYIEAHMFRDGILIASIILIIISLMGSVGYVSNEIKRRSREIAVRKIFGSSSKGVIYLILRSLLLLVAIASVVAIPLSYMISESWLSEYEVKASLDWWIFASSALLVALSITISVVIQTWNIATSNPSKSLKSE